MWDLDSHLDS